MDLIFLYIHFLSQCVRRRLFFLDNMRFGEYKSNKNKNNKPARTPQALIFASRLRLWGANLVFGRFLGRGGGGGHAPGAGFGTNGICTVGGGLRRTNQIRGRGSITTVWVY